MKYGSIYSKDNIENKYNYSSTGGRRSSQNNFKTSHDHHTHSTLNTDGLLRSSSGTGYHSSGSSIKVPANHQQRSPLPRTSLIQSLKSGRLLADEL